MKNGLIRPLTINLNLFLLFLTPPALACGGGTAPEPSPADDPQTVLQRLDPLLKKASARLRPEALDRCCRLGELEYLLKVTDRELKQHEQVLEGARQLPGSAGYRDAGELEQTVAQLREHRAALRQQYETLQREHATRLLVSSRKAGLRPSSRTAQALLQLLRRRELRTRGATDLKGAEPSIAPPAGDSTPGTAPLERPRPAVTTGAVEAERPPLRSSPLMLLLKSRQNHR